MGNVVTAITMTRAVPPHTIIEFLHVMYFFAPSTLEAISRPSQTDRANLVIFAPLHYGALLSPMEHC